MTVLEVEAAKVDRLLPDETGYVITVSTKLYNEIDEHKTNREFGGAQIFLSVEEFTWLERWIQLRKHLAPKNDLVFATKGDGPVKSLVRHLQTAWAQMGLPGRPSFTDIRTAVSAHAKNHHTAETRIRLARYMCHDTSTADRFYSMVLNRRQGQQIREQFMEVTDTASSSRPSTRPSTSIPHATSSTDSSAHSTPEVQLKHTPPEQELEKMKVARRMVVMISPLQRAKQYGSKKRYLRKT
ncbi:hypothetical protein EYF80_061290 [Liparis tanakae]|uniref:Uncharacterized protein n=1 Tax=Liparis tanakae TaxID=230148 RepID=A0A4Z2EJP1_9TELE|nr:hypothetical protein EYF80_061290 [Liparis tanakae]